MRRLNVKANGDGTFEISDLSDQPVTFNQNLNSAVSSVAAVSGLDPKSAEELLRKMNETASSLKK